VRHVGAYCHTPLRGRAASRASITQARGDALSGQPAALHTYLAETLALDEVQIAAFVTALSQSTFARTVAPEAADAFIASVEAD